MGHAVAAVVLSAWLSAAGSVGTKDGVAVVDVVVEVDGVDGLVGRPGSAIVVVGPAPFELVAEVVDGI